MKTIFIALLVFCAFFPCAYSDALDMDEATRFARNYEEELKSKMVLEIRESKKQNKDKYAKGNVFETVALPKYSAEASAETYYFQYREPGVMREKGVFYGLGGAYTFRDKIMLRAEGRGAFGRVDYKNSGTLKNIDDFTLEFRGLGGYGFNIFTSSILTPYFGVGYRYLNDDTKGRTTSTGAAGRIQLFL